MAAMTKGGRFLPHLLLGLAEFGRPDSHAREGGQLAVESDVPDNRGYTLRQVALELAASIYRRPVDEPRADRKFPGA